MGSTVVTHHFADVAQQRQVLAHGHSASREAIDRAQVLSPSAPFPHPW
jgi:hypothetical protein